MGTRSSTWSKSPMRMKEIVDRVVSLSEEFSRRHDVVSREHGVELSLDLTSAKAPGYLEATAQLTDPLDRFLRRLTLDDLRKLQTLVYLGRDKELSRAAEIRDLHEEVTSVSGDAESVRRMIEEKSLLLASYLRDAVALAQELGIDIELPFD